MFATLRSLCSFLVRRYAIVVVLAFFTWAISFSPAHAISATEWTINPRINYQAKLLDSGGTPVSDGTYAIKFVLYDAPVAGNVLWTAKGTTLAPTTLNVPISNGLFTVVLGETSAVVGGGQNALDDSINWNTPNLYLGVSVGTDGEMMPRKRFTTVPQAFNAQMLQGMSASGTAFASQAVFTVSQTSPTYATGTRTALRVVSQGTSNQGDNLIEAVNSSGTNVFLVRRTGKVQIAGSFNSTASSSEPNLLAFNTADKTSGNAWGAWINTALIGPNHYSGVTGTADYSAVISYESAASSGLCIDNHDTALKCPTTHGVSLVTEQGINPSGFDLAERYNITGSVEEGDLLVIDPLNPLKVKRSTNVAYDRSLVGIASTAPGLILGRSGDITMALAGRVPTKVSPYNGAISVGDPLTSSPFPGVAMKATKPGMIVGYALESASATGTIEVFVKVSFDAGSLLRTASDENLLTDQVVVNKQASATVGTQTVDSWGLTFRGSAWDGSQALNQDLTLFQDVLSATSSALSVKSGTSTVWSVNQNGTVRMAGDLIVGGKIFPATRSGVQTDKYIFLDDSMGATSTYVATNADGWQANDSYDFAERYYSPDALQPGDLVVMSPRGKLHVQRSLDEKQMLLGIVSTKPAFVAGAPGPSTYPIALAGRVPTKVSAAKGAIAVGDLLAPSTMPGVAVKATQTGPVVGQALEAFDESGVGSIEVFVNPTWWTGPEKPKVDLGTSMVQGQSTVQQDGTSYRGLARILSGGQRVRVTFPAIGSYPLVQVTPQGNVGDGWWTDNYTQDGFDIILKSPLIQPVTFSWRVEPTEMTNNQMFLSNGQIAPFDRLTGQVPNRFEMSNQETGGGSSVPTTSSSNGSVDGTQPTTSQEVPTSTSTAEIPTDSSGTRTTEPPTESQNVTEPLPENPPSTNESSTTLPSVESTPTENVSTPPVSGGDSASVTES